MSTPPDPCCAPARSRAKRGRKTLFGSALSFALGVLSVLAPKCPLCLSAYLSILGVGFAGASELSPLLLPLGLVLIASSLAGTAIHLTLRRRRQKESARASI